MFKNLSRDIPMKNMSKQNKKDFYTRIKTIDASRHEHIARLMIEYYKNNTSISFTLNDILKEFSLDTVKDENNSTGVIVDFEKLVKDLQWILYRYVMM